MPRDPFRSECTVDVSDVPKWQCRDDVDGTSRGFSRLLNRHVDLCERSVSLNSTFIPLAYSLDLSFVIFLLRLQLITRHIFCEVATYSP